MQHTCQGAHTTFVRTSSGRKSLSLLALLRSRRPSSSFMVSRACRTSTLGSEPALQLHRL